MKIWLLDTLPDEYVLFVSTGEGDKDERMNFYSKFDGRSMLGEKVPNQKLSEDSRKKGDFPHLISGIPVFSEKAVAELQDLLQGATELLPFECNGGRYYVVNVVNVVDGLDREKSRIKYYPHDPSRIMWVDKFIFRNEKVKEHNIFKIPESRANVFVSDIFAEQLRNSDLKGYKLVEMWDSEEE